MTRKKTAKRKPRSKSPSDSLTDLQRAFVFWYMTPGDTLYNATKAAKVAGYKDNESTLSVTGHNNLRNHKIAAAIRERKKQLFSSAEVSVDKVLTDIEMVRQLAIRDGNFAAALKASELHGKHLKMFADKIEHLHTLDDVSTDALIDLARELGSKIDGFGNAFNTRGDGARESADAGVAGAKTTH